jgi:hypothetical protein
LDAANLSAQVLRSQASQAPDREAATLDPCDREAIAVPAVEAREDADRGWARGEILTQPPSDFGRIASVTFIVRMEDLDCGHNTAVRVGIRENISKKLRDETVMVAPALARARALPPGKRHR